MAVELLGGTDKRLPPADAERELRDAFPELFYEFSPRIKRWTVQRRVPWEDVDRLASEGKLDRYDIEAHLLGRLAEGHRDPGYHLIIHAFTVQHPATGEPLEPGSWVVEALRAADTSRHPGGVRGALMDVLRREEERKAAIDASITDQIEQAVEHFSPWLEQNPRSPSWQFDNLVPFGRDAAGTAPADAPKKEGATSNASETDHG